MEEKKSSWRDLWDPEKTEISINYALAWSRHIKDRISLIDMDMVKPMFRLRSIKNKFINDNVDLLLPPGPYSYADFPIISPKVDSCIRHPEIRAVVDLGGDEVGARMLGRYHDLFKTDEVVYIYVFNAFRPGGDNDEDIREMVNSIETQARFKFTGLVHNSHLMGETTVETLKSNIERAHQVAKMLNLPILFHCIRKDLSEEALKAIQEPILQMELFLTPVGINFQ